MVRRGSENQEDRHIAELKVQIDDNHCLCQLWLIGAARLVAMVVLPTPPLALKTVMTFP